MNRTITGSALGALASWIAVALLVAPGGCLISTAAAQAPQTPPAEWDGLVRAEHRKLDQVWLLPQVDFSGYKRVWLTPVDVAFAADWPNRNTRGRVTATDMENIRKTIASEFRQVFADELRRSGYVLVEQGGEDVLLVNAAIVDLFITGPATTQRAPGRTYVTNTGRMTLAAELRDSVTGQLLARAIDTAQARQGVTQFQVSTPAASMADARTAMRRWAEVLRTALDDAEGRSGTTTK
jgi:hypothetical protein